MASELLLLQQQFAALVPKLIQQARELGFKVTLGDAYRDPRVFGVVGDFKGYGHARSAHKNRLAIDLNLFAADDTYLEGTQHHRDLGEWWEQQHPKARWGGWFNDGNHYSFVYNGMQ